MEKIITEGKTIEDALEKLVEKTGVSVENLLYTKEIKKGHLLKNDTIVLTGYSKESLNECIIDILKDIAKAINIEVKFEILNKEGRTTIKIYSNNNAVLIGKDGRTLKALETITRQAIITKTGINYKFNIDIENYRDKKDSRIISLAKRAAKDVLKTKLSIELDSMSSYERRLVHSTLSEYKNIKTRSEGEAPNRRTIIEYVD